MSFLSLAFLAALPLIATPILLHLFDRRRSVVIEWGAMQFLMEAATRKTRARRFQHWLLLLLRVMALAALVLGLARPLAPGNWIGSNNRQETILVIDNSLSTMPDSEGKAVFDELIGKAEDLVIGLDSGSNVRILLSSPYPAWATPSSLRVDAGSRSEIVKLLHELRPTYGTSDVPAALTKAVQSDLADEQLVGRRVVLLTDGQRKDWRIDATDGWSRFKKVFNKLQLPTTIEIVEASSGPSQRTNVAVTRLRTSRTVVGVNQPFTVTAEVRNHSAAQSAESTVRWFLAAEKLQESRLPALQPGETHDLLFPYSFGRTGVYSLGCQIDADDDLVADNRESIVVQVVDRIPVLLVEGSDGFAEMQQDAYLVRAALGRIEGAESEDWQAVFEPRTVPPQRLEAIDLRDFRVVVIPNLTALSRKAVEQLTRFVRDGGGLWVAVGPRTDVDAFNDVLFNQGGGLSPLGLSRIVDESHEEFERPTISPFLKSHPATAQLADNDRLDTSDVKITRRFRFHTPSEGNPVTVLLDLTNGEPLAIENGIGAGRVIVQAIPLRAQWSDLAVSQAFVVMVHDWLGYLTEPSATRHNLMPGEPIALKVTGLQDTHAILSTPDGEDVPVTGDPVEDEVVFRTSRTSLPGNYSLEIGVAGSGIPFHVARDPAESDLTRLTINDRRFLSEIAGLRTGRISTVSGTNYRTPLWPAMLMLLIGILAGELILSGVIARKRFGSVPISETAGQIAEQTSMQQANPIAREKNLSRDYSTV